MPIKKFFLDLEICLSKVDGGSIIQGLGKWCLIIVCYPIVYNKTKLISYAIIWVVFGKRRDKLALSLRTWEEKHSVMCRMDNYVTCDYELKGGEWMSNEWLN